MSNGWLESKKSAKPSLYNVKEKSVQGRSRLIDRAQSKVVIPAMQPGFYMKMTSGLSF
jgi:hypothetical protein